MQILIHRDGQQFGPYPLEQAREYLASGQLRADDLAWHEGAPNWIPLAQVAGISVAAAAKLPTWIPPRRSDSPEPATVTPAAANAVASSPTIVHDPLPQPLPTVRRTSSSNSMTGSLRAIAMRNMGVGGLWFVGGSAVTFFSYEAAASGSGGGTYVMAWGAIIFGGIQFVRGLIQYFQA